MSKYYTIKEDGPFSQIREGLGCFSSSDSTRGKTGVLSGIKNHKWVHFKSSFKCWKLAIFSNGETIILFHGTMESLLETP